MITKISHVKYEYLVVFKGMGNKWALSFSVEILMLPLGGGTPCIGLL